RKATPPAATAASTTVSPSRASRSDRAMVSRATRPETVSSEPVSGREYPCGMGVLGHWRRSALGAGGVALLLPVGLAIGVALTTAFGGSSGLHSLAQVFSGPSMPAAGGRSAAPGLESVRDVPAIPLPKHHAPVVPTASAPSAA